MIGRIIKAIGQLATDLVGLVEPEPHDEASSPALFAKLAILDAEIRSTGEGIEAMLRANEQLAIDLERLAGGWDDEVVQYLQAAEERLATLRRYLSRCLERRAHLLRRIRRRG